MEAERQSFQAQLERVKNAWETKVKLLEDDIRFLKTPGQRSAQKKNVAEKVYKTGNNEQVDISREQVEKRVKEMEKGREAIEDEGINLSQSQQYNAHSRASNLGSKKYITKK